MSRAAPAEPTEPLTEAQQALVVKVLPLIEGIAAKLRQKWGSLMTPDELHAVGREALVEAAQTFDSSQGVTFTTYSTCRIQGAILDAVRRELRHRGPLLEAYAQRAANDYLAEQFNHPSGDDPGDEKGVWRRRSEAFSGGLAAAMVASIAAGVLNSQDGTEEAIARRQAYERVIAAIQAARFELAEKERELLDLHYGKELGLREVAERLGVAYSTAKRIHASMLEHLGDKLQRRGIRTIGDAGMTG